MNGVLVVHECLNQEGKLLPSVPAQLPAEIHSLMINTRVNIAGSDSEGRER